MWVLLLEVLLQSRRDVSNHSRLHKKCKTLINVLQFNILRKVKIDSSLKEVNPNYQSAQNILK